MNDYPTTRQVAALRDVLAHPGDTLAQRAERLECSRPAVLSLLMQLERRVLAVRVDGKWSVTKQGRAWCRPTMPTRSVA